MSYEAQHLFKQRLRAFIEETEAMPRFRGQTKAVSALKRILGLAALQ